ncbi:MAG: hypothetical protein JWR02_697 [Mucilaginibacter sp.]|nr:hypothetical protein [Mucilaginibacter sp.]
MNVTVLTWSRFMLSPFRFSLLRRSKFQTNRAAYFNSL